MKRSYRNMHKNRFHQRGKSPPPAEDEVRAFIAMEISPTDTLKHALDELKKCRGYRPVSPENVHLTLRFLGNIKTAMVESILQIVRDSFRPLDDKTSHGFNVKIAGTGAFPDMRRPRVIWAGVTVEPDILPFVKLIENKLVAQGFKREERVFSPHLTLARLGDSAGISDAVSFIEKYKTTVFAEEKITSVHLKKSTLTTEGPVYEVLGIIKIE